MPRFEKESTSFNRFVPGIKYVLFNYMIIALQITPRYPSTFLRILHITERNPTTLLRTLHIIDDIPPHYSAPSTLRMIALHINSRYPSTLLCTLHITDDSPPH